VQQLPPQLREITVPRFRFHLYNDVHTVDEEGRQFADFDAARIEAISNARELMASDMQTNGEINLAHWIELEDDAGELVVVAFSDAVSVISEI
jgi:hypothetical protein